MALLRPLLPIIFHGKVGTCLSAHCLLSRRVPRRALCFAGSLENCTGSERDRLGASPGEPQPSMAVTDKCLARSNKSSSVPTATNKRPAVQRNFLSAANWRDLVAGGSAAGLHCAVTPFLRNWLAPNMWMAAKNKSLAQSNESRTRARRPRNRTASETGRVMKRCAQCHGPLGLGVRSRNVWNGRWWVHVLYCSTHCEALHKLERYSARTTAAKCVPCSGKAESTHNCGSPSMR
jgi:hypothetical protein